MNERPNTTNFREGFVDPAKQAAQERPREGFMETARQVSQPQAQPKAEPQAMPPPDLEPSPAELDEQQEAAAAVTESWPVVVRLLYKPLTIPGGATLHESCHSASSRGGDINRYGNPCRVNQGRRCDHRRTQDALHHVGAVGDFAAVSGNARSGVIEIPCAYRLRHFFAPDPRAWLSAPTKQ